ncbi:hypothetical protein NVS55_02350 [Myxococcus stipitatus]|uniref:hypothetical protein n=1 Tax=Myxococcus stipitatus TaxID=83455 RepID=UPI003144EF66
MKTSLLTALGLLVGGSALAAPPSSNQDLTLKTRDRSLSMRVTDDNLSSSDVQLAFKHDTVRGNAFGRPVDLTEKDDVLQGTYGQKPVNLKVTDHEDTIVAVGTFGGQVSNFQVSPQQVTGTVGACSYQLLITRHDRYEGWRTCGDRKDDKVSLFIPSSIADEETQLATALSLLLAQ